jgi:hypothetical protein
MEKADLVRRQSENRIYRDQLLTLEDLQEFKEDLLISIKALIQANSSPQMKKWLKSYEVKKILNISTGTLQNLRANGTLPYSKIGGLIYYDSEEINKVVGGQNENFLPATAKSKRNTKLSKNI